MTWRLLVPDERPSAAKAVLLGTAAAAVGVASRYAIHPVLGTDYPFITFFPLLLFAAIRGGGKAASVCLLLCAVGASLFSQPNANFQVAAFGLFVFVLSGGLIAWTGSALSNKVHQLRDAEQRLVRADADLQTLVHELAHRSRNALTVVMAIITQSARKGGSGADLAKDVNARLSAMAVAQDQVLQNGGQSVPLVDLLERNLIPFDLDRFSFQPSPVVKVEPELASALALLTHELATNALKHGALSVGSGSVEIGWKLLADKTQLLWREIGGPTVVPSERVGFGTRLIGAALAPHGGRAERRFDESGVVCVIELPASIQAA